MLIISIILIQSFNDKLNYAPILKNELILMSSYYPDKTDKNLLTAYLKPNKISIYNKTSGEFIQDCQDSNSTMPICMSQLIY
jgi:hypothetical protein